MIHHLECNTGNYKRLPAPQQQISDIAFKRYMAINIGKVFTTDTNNVSRSSCTHREYLQRYNGPITSKEDFDDLQLQMNNTTLFICNALNLPVPVSNDRLFSPLTDPFKSDKVMVITYDPLKNNII